MKIRIGIMGSGSAGAFSTLPKEIIEREDVVLIDTDGKDKDAIVAAAKEAQCELVTNISDNSSFIPAPTIIIERLPEIKLSECYRYDKKRNKHEGQPWAQKRGKNRKGGYGY